MKAKRFEKIHGLGYNNGPYYKKIWKHLFPKDDPHNYYNASKYLTYVLNLRSLVGDVLADKQPCDIYEFFGGNNKGETCHQYMKKLYMVQEKNTIRQTVISRYEKILQKFNVPYEHILPKFKGIWMVKLLIKLKRLILKNTVCKSKGHVSNGYEHNGFIKYTDIPLYQQKCIRCNRYFGEKIK